VPSTDRYIFQCYVLYCEQYLIECNTPIIVRDLKTCQDKRQRSDDGPFYQCSGQSQKAVSKSQQETPFGIITHGKVTWSKDDRDYMKCYMMEYKFTSNPPLLPVTSAAAASSSSASSSKSIKTSAFSLVVLRRYDKCNEPPKASGGRDVFTTIAEVGGGGPLSPVPPLSPWQADDFFERDSSYSPCLPSPAHSTPQSLPPDVSLSKEDCDLDFVHEGGGIYSTLVEGGLAQMWSGARAEVGLRGQEGRFMFEVRILDEIDVPVCKTAKKRTHLCRVGWSCRDVPTYALGLKGDGWAFGATGFKSHGGNFEKFGEDFHVNDIIGCGIDLQTRGVWFAKNGRSLGQAFTTGPAAIERGIFPHVMLKNVRVEVSFASGLNSSNLGNCDFLRFQIALEVEQAQLGLTTSPTLPPEHPEVLMLVGLPKVGKTEWTEKHMAEHPEKNFYVLSTNEIMSRYH